jgi:hypothetical protein
MIVFLRNVPEDASRRDIVDFISPALEGGFFKARGEILSVGVLVVKDKGLNLTEYHAIVSIRPDAVALRVIKKLHGQPFKGRRIALREYVVRNWRNDRRQIKAKPGEVAAERRMTPTRRRNLHIEMKKLVAGGALVGHSLSARQDSEE